MKRLLAIITLISMTFFALTCYAAEGDFYCTYTAKSENGSLFYIDVYCEREISAAVFELGFDGGIAEYREVSSASSDDVVRGNPEADKVIIAFTNSEARTGKLCRVTFKALRAGVCSFDLHMRQACDGDLNYINDLSDHSLSVTLGKDGTAGGASSGSSDKSGASSSDDKSAKSKITKNTADDDDGVSTEIGGLFDVRGNNSLKYALMGAGAAVLAAVLIFGGYMHGKKALIKKEDPQSKTSDDNDQPTDKTE